MGNKKKPVPVQKKDMGNPAPTRKIPHKSWISVLAAVVFLIIFIAAVIIVNTPDEDYVPTSKSLRLYVSARVLEVLEDNAAPDTWTEGLRIGSQELKIEILSGEYKGRTLTTLNYLSAYYNIDAKTGTRIVVLLDTDSDGTLYVADIFSYDRTLTMGGFILLFCAALVIIGGKKGVAALAGLAFTLVCLWALLIPLMMKGISPIPITIAIVILTTAVSLFLLGGATVKTLCATLGCIAGVAVAGVSAAIAGEVMHLGGFSMPEAQELILRTTDSGMTISGFLVCGILIASLGAVMDVAMAIASAVNELHEVNPKLTSRELFKSGMNIGRDAMGTMANTLILAFVGTSLNTLILFRVFDYPFFQVFNSNLISIEILRGIAGSLGIIMTVPLVAFISAQIQARRPINAK